MNRVLLLGAGKIGGAIAKFLSAAGGYEVVVGDADPAALRRIKQLDGVQTLTLSAIDQKALRQAMRGCNCVVSACSFAVNPGIAQAALESGISYFDLTEDRETTAAIRKVAASAKPGQIFMPQC